MMSSSIILNNSNNNNNNNNNNTNNNNNSNNSNNNDAGGKTSKSPLIVPMNKKEKTPSSSSPSGTNKKDDNETIVLEEEEEEEEGEEELPKSKLHEEMMEIYNCYNANCLALEADPEKKDNWQSSKKYPGEVLCVKCSNDEKREIAEKKKLAKEKKQAEAKARTTRATSKRPHSPLLSDKHENERKERYDDENMEGEEEEEEEEEETEETEDHVPLSKLAVLKGKESTPLPLPRQPTAKSNKKKSKPQWLKDWYSEEWWGRGDKKKFKVYTYEELFNPERKPKLSMEYLEVVEAHIDAFSKNPRFIRLGSLPKQNNFANDRPPPPTRAEEKKKGPVTIHRVRSSHGTHNKPQYIRRVTLAELMDAELITAGLNVLSMEYRGKEYKANITKNRQIAFQGKSYNEPASFSLAVKRLASPEMKFSNPWTHPGGVKYKDKHGRLQFLGTLREKFFSMTGRNDLLGLPKADSNRMNDVQTRKSRTITVTTSAKLSNFAQKSSTDKGTRNIMLVGESPLRKKARKQVPKLYAPVTDTSMDNMWLDSPSDHGIERDHEQEYDDDDDDDDDEVLMKKKEGMDNDVMTTDEAVEIAVNHRDGSLIYTAEKKRKNVVRPKANFYRRFPDLT